MNDSDCGQISSEEALNSAKKEPDSTGDAYEYFPDDQGENFTGSELLEIATHLKEYGNKAFKSGDLKLALDKYQKGLRYLNEYNASSEDTKELHKQIKQLRFTLHSNSSLLQLKLKSYDAAQSSADNALELGEDGVSDQDRAKAYYRKALALLGLKDDEGAVTSLETAQKLAPGDAAISKELGAAKRKAAEHAKKEKAAYKKFFE